jgi:hypothetical protein
VTQCRKLILRAGANPVLGSRPDMVRAAVKVILHGDGYKVRIPELWDVGRRVGSLMC